LIECLLPNTAEEAGFPVTTTLRAFGASLRRIAVTLEAIQETKTKATWLTLVGMGFLTLFFPYVFVWFIQRPEYPKAFRWILSVWAVIWCGSAILFFAVNILGLNPRG
jgi:hypothetical protein